MDCIFDDLNHLGRFLSFLLRGTPFDLCFFLRNGNAYIIKEDNIVKMLSSISYCSRLRRFMILIIFQLTVLSLCCRSKGDQLPRTMDVKFQSSCENTNIMVLIEDGLLAQWSRWCNLGDWGARS